MQEYCEYGVRELSTARAWKPDSEADTGNKGKGKVSYEKLLEVAEKIKEVIDIVNSERSSVMSSLYEIMEVIEEISEKEGRYLEDLYDKVSEGLKWTLVDAIIDFAVKELQCDPDVEKYYVPSSEDVEICAVHTDKGLYALATDLEDTVWVTRVDEEDEE